MGAAKKNMDATREAAASSMEAFTRPMALWIDVVGLRVGRR